MDFGGRGGELGQCDIPGDDLLDDANLYSMNRDGSQNGHQRPSAAGVCYLGQSVNASIASKWCTFSFFLNPR